MLARPQRRPTVAAEHQRRGRTLDAALGHRVGHYAGVVAHIRRLHLGDVQVPRLLRDEAAGVLLDEGRVLVEDPGKHQICWDKRGWKKMKDYLQTWDERAWRRRTIL